MGLAGRLREPIRSQGRIHRGAQKRVWGMGALGRHGIPSWLSTLTNGLQYYRGSLT